MSSFQVSVCDWKDNVSCGEAAIGGGKELGELEQVEELGEVGELEQGGNLGEIEELVRVEELVGTVELKGKGEQGDDGEKRKLVEQFIEPVGKGEQWKNENKGKDGKPGEPGEYGEKRDMAVGTKEGQELRTWVSSKLAGHGRVKNIL